MNKGKKGSGFAGKAGEPRRAGIEFIQTVVMLSNGDSFDICTQPKRKHGYKYLETVVWDGSTSKPALFTDADVLGSIKAHLRACERCYYGDKK